MLMEIKRKDEPPCTSHPASIITNIWAYAHLNWIILNSRYYTILFIKTSVCI